MQYHCLNMFKGGFIELENMYTMYIVREALLPEVYIFS